MACRSASLGVLNVIKMSELYGKEDNLGNLPRKKKRFREPATGLGSRRPFWLLLRVPEKVIIGTKGAHTKNPVVKLGR